VLIAIAKEFDLHPVVDYDDFELDDVLEEAKASSDGSRLFRRFKPTFQGSHPSLLLASRLNSAFVFRKGKVEEKADVPERDPKQRKLQARGDEASTEFDKQELRTRQATASEAPYKRSSRFKHAR
jgi:hypothetical protein